MHSLHSNVVISIHIYIGYYKELPTNLHLLLFIAIRDVIWFEAASHSGLKLYSIV